MSNNTVNIPTPQNITPKQNSYRPIILAATITVVILAVVLMAFNRFTKQQPAKQPKINPLFAGFACPVDQLSCKNSKPVKWHDNPALAFNLPSNTQIKRAIPAISSLMFGKAGQNSGFGLYESLVVNGVCYTLTYTFPSDAKIVASSSATLRLDPIANLGQKELSLEGQKVNFILQLQKRSLSNASKNNTANSIPSPEDIKNCANLTTPSKDFGDYQTIDANLFK